MPIWEKGRKKRDKNSRIKNSILGVLPLLKKGALGLKNALTLSECETLKRKISKNAMLEC